MSDMHDLRLVTSADVYKSGIHVGMLHRFPDRTEFRYSPQYLAVGGPPVSWSLPLRPEPFTAPAAAVPAFFAGLLPEGRRLSAVRRGVGTSADDEFSILLAVGSDTIGDVQVTPAGQPPRAPTPVMVADFGSVSFAELFARAIGQPPDRTGLPGVQDKVSGAMMNLPVEARASAYILKLNPPEFPHLVENEHFFFRAARRTRLRVAQAELVRDREQEPALLVRRFDRVPADAGGRSLAVEDACQVLGRWPGDKYVLPVEEAITGLARRCRAPGAATIELFRMLLFAYLSGNGDLHAKNLSIYQDERGEWRVTPAYDLPSSALYGDDTLALPVAGKIRQQLSWPLLRTLAHEVGLPEKLAASVVREQCAAAAVWVDEIPALPFNRNLLHDLQRLVRARIRSLRTA